MREARNYDLNQKFIKVIIKTLFNVSLVQMNDPIVGKVSN